MSSQFIGCLIRWQDAVAKWEPRPAGRGMLPLRGARCWSAGRADSGADVSLDLLFADTRRAFFANRGVWEAIATSGPHPGFSHQPADIETYLGVLDDFLAELSSS